MTEIIIEETCGTLKRRYRVDSLGRLIVSPERHHTFSLKQFIYEAFLPEGYPSSVSADYLAYQIWDSVQALCSSLTGTLATRAILVGSGVGESSASATAAVMNWIIRDGVSRVGRIWFTWVQGSNLDCNAKTWRLMADILNDIALFLEILIGVFPMYFLLLASVAGVLKSIVGVAGGATRAALTQHQARRNNMADVSAKDGSQETAIGLLGMLLAMAITPVVGDSQLLIWLCFWLFTSLHLYSNYKAVTSVIMDRMNRQRANILIDAFIASKQKTVPTPLDVAKREKVIYFNSKDVVLGARVQDMTSPSVTDATLWQLIHDYEHENFIIRVLRKNQRVERVLILLHRHANSHDFLKSYFIARLIQRHADVLLQDREALFQSFLKALRDAGWNTTDVLLGATEWRFAWRRSSD
jgi:hypothetical protein